MECGRFWIYRFAYRTPGARAWFAKLEDDRLFLLELDLSGPEAKPVNDDFFKDVMRARSGRPPRPPSQSPGGRS